MGNPGSRCRRGAADADAVEYHRGNIKKEEETY